VTQPATPKVFISYSHKDVAWKDLVLEHLRVLENAGELTVWDDHRISAGDEWRKEIETAMQAAEVAVLLVSTDFLNSAFIRGTEIPRLLARRQDQGLRIIPVFVRPCAWKAVRWLATLQGRPRNGKTLAELRESKAERQLAELALEVGELLGRAPDKQVAPEPQVGVASPAVSVPLSEPLTPLPTGPDTDRGAAFLPAPPEPGVLLDVALRDREPSLGLRRASDKAVTSQTGTESLPVVVPRSESPAPLLTEPKSNGGPVVSTSSEPDFLDEAPQNCDPSLELRPASNIVATPQPEAGSPVSAPRSESPALLAAGAETDGGPPPSEPVLLDETLRSREAGLEFRKARKKSIVAFTLSTAGLLFNIDLLGDYPGLGYKLFVLCLAIFFSLGGLGLGISADKDLDRLRSRKMKWAAALAIGIGGVAIFTALGITFNFKY